MTITKTDRDEVMPWALFGREPAAIEVQEACGQDELVKSDLLPAQNQNKDAWERLGFTFGPPLVDDPLFCKATFPEGWKKVPTPHAMHTDIVDDKGRKRGGIFYKAAFYDRRAHMYPPDCRFTLNNEYYDDQNQQSYVVWDHASGRVKVFESEKYSQNLQDEGYWAASDATKKQAADWLKANYPNYLDCLAYWD